MKIGKKKSTNEHESEGTRPVVKKMTIPEMAEVPVIDRGHTIIRGDATYGAIRLPNGLYAWLKFQKGKQEQMEKLTAEGINDRTPFPKYPSNVLVLPTGPGRQRSPQELFDRIRETVSQVFRAPSESKLALICHYIFCTWLYDFHHGVGYLAFTGLPGCGKSQALEICHLLSFNAFKGSGADTDAAIERAINLIRGTLILDESQKTDSDSGTTFHKVLALGTQSGGVLTKNRQGKRQGDWEPESFQLFGPKILAASSLSPHEAVARRTHEISVPYVPADKLGITPERIHDPSLLKEIESLRNDLNYYRQARLVGEAVSPNIEVAPIIVKYKFNNSELQINRWLFVEAPSEETLCQVVQAIGEIRTESKQSRLLEFDHQVLLAVGDCFKVNQMPHVSQPEKIWLKRICDRLHEWGHNRIDPRSVGSVLRKHGLRDQAHGSKGTYLRTNELQLTAVFQRLGLGPLLESSSPSPESPTLGRRIKKSKRIE